MTRHPIQVLEDGTRLYANGVRYTPVASEVRKYQTRKPDHPDAVRWYGNWLLPLELIDDLARRFPETRPDTDAYDHMGNGRACRCDVCTRPEAERWRTKWWKERGVRF